MEVLTDRELLHWWKDAWERTDKRNPYSPEVDALLGERGISAYDIHTRTGILRGKRKSELDYDEDNLLAFHNRVMFVSENALIDNCAQTTPGSIFLLESRHGYRKGVDVNLSSNEGVGKTTIQWGVSEEVVEDLGEDDCEG